MAGLNCSQLSVLSILENLEANLKINVLSILCTRNKNPPRENGNLSVAAKGIMLVHRLVCCRKVRKQKQGSVIPERREFCRLKYGVLCYL